MFPLSEPYLELEPTHAPSQDQQLNYWYVDWHWIHLWPFKPTLFPYHRVRTICLYWVIWMNGLFICVHRRWLENIIWYLDQPLQLGPFTVEYRISKGLFCKIHIWNLLNLWYLLTEFYCDDNKLPGILCSNLAITSWYSMAYEGCTCPIQC